MLPHIDFSHSAAGAATPAPANTAGQRGSAPQGLRRAIAWRRSSEGGSDRDRAGGQNAPHAPRQRLGLRSTIVL